MFGKRWVWQFTPVGDEQFDLKKHRISFADITTLKELLHANWVVGESAEGNNGVGYLFMFDATCRRPYPSVIIWKFRSGDGINSIHDMRPWDKRALLYAYDRFLRKRGDLPLKYAEE